MWLFYLVVTAWFSSIWMKKREILS
jgi:hypothetical protein